MASRSSRSRSAARLEMLRKILSLISSGAVLSAMTSLSFGNFLEQHLHSAVVDEDDVFEDEHELADFFGKLRILLLDARHDVLLARLVHDIEHFGDRLNAAELLGIDGAESRKLLLEDLVDLRDEVGRDEVEVRDTKHDFGLNRFGQALEHFALLARARDAPR